MKYLCGFLEVGRGVRGEDKTDWTGVKAAWIDLIKINLCTQFYGVRLWYG